MSVRPGGSRRTFRSRWIISAGREFNCSFRAGPVGRGSWVNRAGARSEANMVRGVVGAVRALFAPRRRVKLSGSSSATGGRRMARRIAAAAAFLALVGLGLSVYARCFYDPALTEPPVHPDDGEPLPVTDKFEELAKSD